MSIKIKYMITQAMNNTNTTLLSLSSCSEKRYERGGGFSSSQRGGYSHDNDGAREPVVSPRKEFMRSMSNDNWRERGDKGKDDDEGGDWRRAGGSKDRWGGE